MDESLGGGGRYFLKPNAFERLMNKTVGMLAGFGIGPSYIHLLQVRGRRTGRAYSTPVNLFRFKGRIYLVGGRGHSAWSRNAAAAGEITLRRGKHAGRYRPVAVSGPQKLEILKGYLEEYRGTVQRFFEVAAGSPPEAFREIADRHPVFELSPI